MNDEADGDEPGERPRARDKCVGSASDIVDDVAKLTCMDGPRQNGMFEPAVGMEHLRCAHILFERARRS